MAESLDDIDWNLPPIELAHALATFYDHVDGRVANTFRSLVPKPAEGEGIVIIVDLPQPLHKVSQYLEAVGNIWPGTQVNVKPEGPAALLGNWCVHIEAEQ